MTGLLQERLRTEQEVKASTTALEGDTETFRFPADKGTGGGEDRGSPHFTLPLHFDGSPTCSLQQNKPISKYITCTVCR